MVAGVEMVVETTGQLGAGDAVGLELRLLGPMLVRRDGRQVPLPASRKVRGLLAYLALAPGPVPRAHLCELLWEVPNDPRGELRWCLSKIRRLLDTPERSRVRRLGDSVGLDLAGGTVDAIGAARAADDLATLPIDALRTLVASLAGDFLAGLEIDRSPAFTAWLTAQRRRFRDGHIAALQRLADHVDGDEALIHLEAWRGVAPFDRRVHERLLVALARSGRIGEGETHLAATIRLFAAEGLDATGLRAAWRAAKAQHGAPLPALTVAQPPAAPAAGATGAVCRRASIAVMPLADPAAGDDRRGGAADALAHDLITRLAKLRSLLVIAQGSVFALHERQLGGIDAGRMLAVDYVVAGAVRRHPGRLTVAVELIEMRTRQVVWAETFDQRLDDLFLVLELIGDRIVAAVASEIETIERNRAVLRPPSSLDAWGAHHRGLWHAYRFNRTDNAQARHFFERAVRLDPTFARAHAGLSFTHFQDAFQGWAARQPAIDRAFAAAGESLLADDRDPAAHMAMGRALWLRGRHDVAVHELGQAVELSPNFALGHYTLGFMQSQAGDAEAAIAAADRSRTLSPFDPLLFGMFGAKAMALARLGRFAEAAEWGVRAAARPNAHAHILAIAAYTLALAGRLDDARRHLAAIRATLPAYDIDDFLTAMRFDANAARLFRTGARRLGSS